MTTTTGAPRIAFDVAPEAYEALRGLERYLARCGLPHELIELVKLRVSMINGCAFCTDMHWRRLREAGEPEPRLYGLGAWREAPGYSARERAALAWAEAVTALGAAGVPDAAYAEAEAAFTRKEIADLTWAVAAINAWNRVCAAFRIPVPADTSGRG
jgi:AhpD family alkylhydroperoxidase